MTTRYAIRVHDSATADETTVDRTLHDAKAVAVAEQEAARLAEQLGRALDTHATRIERDGWGRYLVWKPLGERAEEAAYIVTVEEEQ